ncbi:hypothetical protein V2J09_018142 [Rumex salicifolius]
MGITIPCNEVRFTFNAEVMSIKLLTWTKVDVDKRSSSGITEFATSISSVNQNSHGIRAHIMPIDDESTHGSQISKELKLHNSDHPNYVLATTLLNERNYGHWRRFVEVSLRAKNKIGMVTGTCKKPDDKSPDAEQWEVVNNMLILQEEDQRKGSNSFKQDQDALALAAHKGGPKDASKDQRQGSNSFKQDQDALALAAHKGGPKDASKGSSRGQPRCWKLHGYPPGKGLRAAAQASARDNLEIDQFNHIYWEDQSSP